MNNLWTETGYVSLNKTGEQLCGDRVEVTGGGEANHTTLVLADGLGSGVKGEHSFHPDFQNPVHDDLRRHAD